jgi:hypothetical protein
VSFQLVLTQQLDGEDVSLQLVRARGVFSVLINRWCELQTLFSVLLVVEDVAKLEWGQRRCKQQDGFQPREALECSLFPNRLVEAPDCKEPRTARRVHCSDGADRRNAGDASNQFCQQLREKRHWTGTRFGD